MVSNIEKLLNEIVSGLKLQGWKPINSDFNGSLFVSLQKNGQRIKISKAYDKEDWLIVKRI